MPPLNYAVEVVPGDRWTVQQQTTGRIYGTHRFKFVAVFGGRCVARAIHAELFIKNRDGTIGSRDSYGGDSPRRPG